MSKATITMVMSTTGFGATSTLATQRLHSSDGYFGDRSNNDHGNDLSPRDAQHPRRQVPRFDMNLKDLFSEEEIASRPLTHQPQLQGFLRGTMKPPPISPHLPNTNPSTTKGAPQTQHSPHFQQPQQPSPQFSERSSNFETTFQTPQPFPFAQPQQAAAAAPPTNNNFSFHDLDFLNDYHLPDTGSAASGTWNQQHLNSDTDLGYGYGSVGGGFGMGNGGAGAGGGAGSGMGGTTGFDGSGAWEANQQFFEEFFFGTGAGTGSGGGVGF
jgi:hypothetical protein